MPSVFKSNSAALRGDIREQAAKNLLAAAVFYQTQLMAKLGERTPAVKTIKKGKRSRRVFVPPFSLPGEYPMKRTGFLQQSILIEPTKVSEVEKDLRIKVGYSFNAFYGSILEFKLLRNGLMKTLKDLEPYLTALAQGVLISDRK